MNYKAAGGIALRHHEDGGAGILTRRVALLVIALCVVAWAPANADTDRAEPSSADHAMKMAVQTTGPAALEQHMPAPELGQQMLELQIRHNRLWWAGQAGNWNLAYYMVSELGEALRGIEATNGDAPELQPQKLSERMPAIMNPAIRTVQQALEQHDKIAFGRAFDKLSAACTTCHTEAGFVFLHLQRPKTPLLNNLRYAPLKGK